MNKMMTGFCHAKKTKFDEDKVLLDCNRPFSCSQKNLNRRIFLSIFRIFECAKQ